MDFQNWEILRQLNEKFLASVEMALVFGNKLNHAIIITSDDDVFGIGDNTNACLTTVLPGTFGYYQLPTEISIMSKKGVAGIVCGGDGNEDIFLVAYLCSGEIYWWGRVPYQICTINTPTKIGVFQKQVKTVACGGLHCIILTDDGQVFTWGQNSSGQLGRRNCTRYSPDTNRSISGAAEPGRVEGIIKNQTVIDVSCGYDFTVTLLEDGRVVTWGNNNVGQLGLNCYGSSSSTPYEVPSLRNYYCTHIVKIACGLRHVLALAETGTLYGWGCNSYYQVNPLATPIDRFGCPMEIQVNNLRFTDIGASYLRNLSAAKCENGKVYMCGETIQGNKRFAETECESIDQVFVSFAKPRIMLKPLKRLQITSKELSKVEEIEGMSVTETLEKELNNPDTSNLKIVIDDKEIYVHQDILKMRSEYFNVMITRWLEKDENLSTITMKEKSYAAIEAYLKYLYTDKLEVDLNLAVELLQLADEYGDDKFKSLCEKNVQRNMTVDKVADVFALIRKFEKYQNLNRFCLEFVLRHATEVMSSPGFQAWDMDTMKVFVDEYVKIKGNCR